MSAATVACNCAHAKPEGRSFTRRLQSLTVFGCITDAGGKRVKYPTAACHRIDGERTQGPSVIGRHRVHQQERVALRRCNTWAAGPNGSNHVVDNQRSAKCAQSGPDCSQFRLRLHRAHLLAKNTRQKQHHNHQNAPLHQTTRRSASHTQPPPLPMAACPIFHNGRNTPSASSNTSTPIIANRIGSMAADRPLMA